MKNSTLLSCQVPVPKFAKECLGEAEAKHVAQEIAEASDLQDILKGPKPMDLTSEVPGVTWDKRDKKWRVELGPKKIQGGYFTEKPAAEAKALELAKKHGLGRHVKSERLVGVMWDKREKKWRVRVKPPGKKRISGGSFTEKAAAEAKALALAKEHSFELRKKAVGKLSELPIFKPKVPYRGVRWEQGEQQWHAQCHVNGARRHFRLKPKDHSEVELEASFQKAVAWKKRQEIEKEKIAKAKIANKNA